MSEHLYSADQFLLEINGIGVRTYEEDAGILKVKIEGEESINLKFLFTNLTEEKVVVLTTHTDLRQGEKIPSHRTYECAAYGQVKFSVTFSNLRRRSPLEIKVDDKTVYTVDYLNLH